MFDNKLKMSIARGLVDSVQNLGRQGQVKNQQGAYNLAVINLLERLMVEMADKVSNEDFIDELEVVLAEETVKTFNLAKLSQEQEKQRIAAQELEASQRLEAAKAKKQGKQ